MAIAVQARRQERLATVAPRRRSYGRRKCPACDGVMTVREHWGATGSAWVCGKCITSIAA